MSKRSFLTETQLRERVPAVFSSSPSEKVSKRYVFVPTYKIVEDFKKLGWHPVWAAMNYNGAIEHSKHMVRFAKKSEALNVGEIVPEILVMNSHDRTFQNVIEAGFFRCVCSNQAVVSDGLFSRIVQKHINIDFEAIEKIIKESIKHFSIVTEKIDEYKTINLTEVEKGKFALLARNTYWGENSIIDPKLLLNAKRTEDEGNSLWLTYNTIQENIQKGGVSYIGKNEEGKIRKRTTKETKNIVRDFKINQFLWAAMVNFAATKKF